MISNIKFSQTFCVILHIHKPFVISAVTKCKKPCTRNAVCKIVKGTETCVCKDGYEVDKRVMDAIVCKRM